MKYKANCSGVLKDVDAMIIAVKNTDKILGKFGKHMRHQVQAKFDAEGPGWQKRSPATEGKRGGAQAKGLAQSTDRAQKKFAGKLRREYERAKRSGNPVRAASRKRVYEALQQLNAGKDIGPGPKLTASQKDALKKRAALAKHIKKHKLKDGKERLQVFDRVNRKELEGAGEVRAQTAIRKIGERLQRAGTETSGRVLGRMANSIYTQVKFNKLYVGSKIPWADVHNSGGTAGHGARQPERKFLKLEDDDMNVLAAVIEETVAEAYEKKKKKK